MHSKCVPQVPAEGSDGKLELRFPAVIKAVRPSWLNLDTNGLQEAVSYLQTAAELDKGDAVVESALQRCTDEMQDLNAA